MEVTLFTTYCPRCGVLEKKLENANIDFVIVDDVDTVVEKGEEVGILSAPILEVDGQYMDFTKAVQWVNEGGKK